VSSRSIRELKRSEPGLTWIQIDTSDIAGNTDPHMRKSVARALLEGMLAGQELQEEDLRTLAGVDGENLYVDFKHGRELDDTKKAAKTVRQYTAGFANADGGLLVIGVSDGEGKATQRQFTATTRPGGRPLHEWARTVLEPLAGSLSPPPRLQTVVVDGIDVLVIGMGRAPSLVGCLEEGELKYYLRLADSTLAIPPYLMSDLVLGRRSHPEFGVTGGGVIDGSTMKFQFEVLNESMVAAEDVVVGVVSSAIGERNGGLGREASPYIRQFVDVLPPWSARDERLEVVHVSSRQSGSKLDLPAFDRSVLRDVRVGVFRQEEAIPVRSALYVLASGHPPQWFQFDWFVPTRSMSTGPVRVVGTPGDRPVVEWGADWRTVNPGRRS